MPTTIIRISETNEKNTYIVKEEIGSGGFAFVYRVINANNRIEYALKVIPREAMENEEFKAKHFSEISIQNKLNHQNIVKTYDNWVDEMNTYLLMELCKKGSIGKLLKSRGYLSETETSFIINGVVSGVQYMHEHSIIHRDLKLDNFMLGDDGHVKISDFGISEEVKQEREKDLVFAGTPSYLSPEVIQLKCYGYQVDIWAIGVCTYELLTGHLPFESKEMGATYEKIKQGEFRFPQELRLSFSAKDFVESALNVRPEYRPNIKEISLHPFLSYNNRQVVLNNQSVALPTFWVKSYIEKEGIAYCLNDGCIGMCFNDFTRFIIDPHRLFIQCWPSYQDTTPLLIDMKKIDGKEPHISVLLEIISYFDDQNRSICESHYKSSVPLNHVKYWLKKDGAILFRMDNRAVQVISPNNYSMMAFFDKKIAYINENQQNFGELIEFEEIEKRKLEKEHFSLMQTLLRELTQ